MNQAEITFYKPIDGVPFLNAIYDMKLKETEIVENHPNDISFGFSNMDDRHPHISKTCTDENCGKEMVKIYI